MRDILRFVLMLLGLWALAGLVITIKEDFYGNLRGIIGLITMLCGVVFLWQKLDVADEKEKRAHAAMLDSMTPEQQRSFYISELRSDLTRAWDNRAAATRGGDFAAVAEYEAQIAKIEIKLRELGG